MVKDYHYFKSIGHTLNYQLVIDGNKCFLNLYFEICGSTNNAKVLYQSSFYHLTIEGALFYDYYNTDGFCSYIVGDSGHGLLPSLMDVHHVGSIIQQEIEDMPLYSQKVLSKY